MLAVAVVSAGVQYYQTQQTAKKAEESARQSQALSMEAYGQQQQQIQAQATDSMSDRAREAMIERGRLRVVNGESGLTGNSSDQQERQSYFNEATDMARIEGNRGAQQNQAALGAKGVTAQTNSRLNNIKQPSLIGTGLQIAGSAAGAYGNYSSNQARMNAA